MLLLFASCEKVEKPVNLPARGTATPATVHMGENYLNQVFFDIETNKVVYTSESNSWDLAFEASPGGKHLFINGLKLAIYNAGQKDYKKYTQAEAESIAFEKWKVDSPTGWADSTATGDWTNASGLSKNDLYILKNESGDTGTAYYKLILTSATPQGYTFLWGDFNSPDMHEVKLVKEDDFNFVYFSFASGVVNPEPPKATWDIVFTRYMYIYYTPQYNGFAYPVSGVLLNPYKTMAALLDSNADYALTNEADLSKVTLRKDRDAIGFGWKIYSGTTSNTYVVDKKKVYLLHTKSDYYWKLHFTDFYDETGKKGAPSFEFERLK